MHRPISVECSLVTCLHSDSIVSEEVAARTSVTRHSCVFNLRSEGVSLKTKGLLLLHGNRNCGFSKPRHVLSRNNNGNTAVMTE